MEIGIIGTGNMGSLYADYLVKLGHTVKIANSRGGNSLSELATKTGANATTVEDAASAVDIVIIAIPQKEIPNLPIEILSASKAIIIDSGNYYPSRDGKISDLENGLTDSEWVAKIIGHPVIKAFNNIGSQSFANRAAVAGAANRVSLSVAGDNEQDKKVVSDIIDAIGFDVVDTGVLAESWRQQPGMPTYTNDLSREELETRLKNADYSKKAEYLAIADEQARPYFR